MLALVAGLAFAQAPQAQTQGEIAQRAAFRRMMDWGGFNRYAEANKSLTSSPKVVFMGDSITDFWAQYRPDFFADNDYLGRGIGAQSIEQMVTRFQQDVVDLHPKAVVILAGINNIAGNNGSMSLENIAACLKTMCEISKANNIIPIVCSLLPCDRFFWNEEKKPAQDVIKLNSILKSYSEGAGIAFVDFHSQMGQPDGSLPAVYSQDGCHPTVEGYEKMEEIIVPLIDKALSHADALCAARQTGPTDWPGFKRYEEANAITAAKTQAPLLVLMGDSITDYWYDSDREFFDKNNFAGRGIAGQTASQMLVRFNRDVIALYPKAVAIMAGTNDLCQNLASMAYYPDDAIIDNTIAMCELAENAGIKVLLCSITPCAHYMPIPKIDAGSRIVELNAKLKAYADAHKNVTYVDYFTPLANAENGLDDDCSYDGIHPCINIYDDMENILVQALRKSLKLGNKTDFRVLDSLEADRLKAQSDAERRAKNLPMNFSGMLEMMQRYSKR